ncbi:MAG: tryptophan synthase subunit alpha [Clostridiales Family XIII bacterium]|jgi:tryptophan synthase alpha chain|nr:tryptophan synthase subunit alpha [Clostridiales Family XIII bacterium]
MNKGRGAARIEGAFAGGKALITFLTGGDPGVATTEKLIRAMDEEGADLIEIGIPFSDPIAEGPIIQDADERALAAGTTVDDLFAMVARLRAGAGGAAGLTKPLLFMTYYNPIFTYGVERFAAKCVESGLDGLIVPDVPYEESGEIKAVFEPHGIAIISMIAPTSADRETMIAKDAQGFLYCVSSLGVTGVRSEIRSGIGGIIEAVRQVSGVPCAIGFGISTPAQAEEMAVLADGVIVGSAIVRIIAEHGAESEAPVRAYVRAMKDALRAK